MKTEEFEKINNDKEEYKEPVNITLWNSLAIKDNQNKDFNFEICAIVKNLKLSYLTCS